MLNVLAWLEIHRVKLIAAFALLLVVFGVAYLWRHLQEQKVLRANGALLAIQGPVTSMLEPETVPDPAEYLKIADEYEGTLPAARARLLAASAYFRNGRYAEAAVEFEKVARGRDDGTLAPQAAYGLAASLDAQDKLEEARAQYQRVVSQYPDSSVASQARLALARIHQQQGQPEAALRLYEEVLRAPDRGPFAEQADEQRAALLRNHPELAAASSEPAPALTPQ